MDRAVVTRKPLVVSIGTTHPWNIAGVGLDLQIGAELNVRVLTAVAAVSAQDASGIHALHAVPPEVVRAQLQTIPWNAVDAVRVGALASVDAVHEVVRVLRDARNTLAVVDPVLAATRGGTFADDATIAVMRDELATLPNVILTPNLPEAARLLARDTIGAEHIEEAARLLHARGAYAVLLKGGHLDGEPVDVLADPLGVMTLRGGRLPLDMRGTGCALAMSLACALAEGMPLLDAVVRARAFVREKIAHAVEFAGLHVAY